jgi:pimeloyl-ACP methyl ester carboxylesterase
MLSMELFYRKTGNERPLIILHGLYGMSDNWLTIARFLSDIFTVWLPDLRNHGRSPHTNSHTYYEMADDIYHFIKTHNIQMPIIIGHSMGGKLALIFDRKFPNIASKLIIVDIAPVNYSNYGLQEITFHKKIIDSLLKLDVKSLKNRNDADVLLSESIKNQQIRAFLLKNLQRNKENEFYWLINLPILKTYLPHIIDGFENWTDDFKIQKPTLFIKGQLSQYIRDEFIINIKKTFNNVTIKTIPSAGHWLHIEKTNEFIKIIKEFC